MLNYYLDFSLGIYSFNFRGLGFEFGLFNSGFIFNFGSFSSILGFSFSLISVFYCSIVSL